jgi:predicted  nucleic acid-binding Zn-ribbon protein
MASKLLNNYPQIDMYLRCLYEAEQMSFPNFGNEDDWKSVSREEYDEVHRLEKEIYKLQQNKKDYLEKRLSLYQKIFDNIKKVVEDPTPEMLEKTYRIPKDIIKQLDFKLDRQILKNYIKQMEEMP